MEKRDLPCLYQFCVEVKYKMNLFQFKIDLLKHLRMEYENWAKVYDELYAEGTYTRSAQKRAEGWDYTDKAKEMITRCRMYDNLYNKILLLNLLDLDDFGNYCKKVFIEINKLKPAFSNSISSQSSFDQTVKELRKFVMVQNTATLNEEPVEAEMEASRV